MVAADSSSSSGETKHADFIVGFIPANGINDNSARVGTVPRQPGDSESRGMHNSVRRPPPAGLR